MLATFKKNEISKWRQLESMAKCYWTSFLFVIWDVLADNFSIRKSNRSARSENCFLEIYLEFLHHLVFGSVSKWHQSAFFFGNYISDQSNNKGFGKKRLFCSKHLILMDGFGVDVDLIFSFQLATVSQDFYDFIFDNRWLWKLID